MKKIFAFLPDEQTEKGFIFEYLGEPDTCKGCEFKERCHGMLAEGTRYIVVERRDPNILCKLRKRKISSVLVEKAPIKVGLPSKFCKKDAIIMYKRIKCKNVLCKYFDICVANGLKEGTKCKIIEVEGEIICPLEREKLFRCLLKPF